MYINLYALLFREPVKEAMSPSVAESLRATFAAFLWHEGIVHDAMACASFLKFHPTLPKQGAMVVTRHTERYLLNTAWCVRCLCVLNGKHMAKY